MSYLEIKSLSAFYGKAQALSDISLSVEEGEIIAIVGANGAGKSTLLDSIMGLVRQTGQIDFDGSVISGKSTSHIVKSGIGYAPERFNLFPYMNVKDNLLVGAFAANGHCRKPCSSLFPLSAAGRARNSGNSNPIWRRTPNGVPRSRAHDVSEFAFGG